MLGKNNYFWLKGTVGFVELIDTKSGKTMLKVSLAQNRKSKANPDRKPLWHKLIAFDELAEKIYTIVKKGNLVTFDGKIDYAESRGRRFTNFIIKGFSRQISKKEKYQQESVKQQEPEREDYETEGESY